MTEKEFENILSKYPELIEDGLVLKGRQVRIKGKIMDLLFDDRYGQKLILEIKRGIVVRKDIAQLMDYEGDVLSADDPNVRVMLIGNRVPPNLRRSLDHHGFEWKEISVSMLINFIKEKNDNEFLQYFPEEEVESIPNLKEKYRGIISHEVPRIVVEDATYSINCESVIKQWDDLYQIFLKRQNTSGWGKKKDYVRRIVDHFHGSIPLADIVSAPKRKQLATQLFNEKNDFNFVTYLIGMGVFKEVLRREGEILIVAQPDKLRE